MSIALSQVLVFYNGQARSGKSAAHWDKIHAALQVRFSGTPNDLVRVEADAPLNPSLGLARPNWIAVGGDGTLFAAVNHAMALGVKSKAIKIGAIGTGSSNDAHKPRSQSPCAQLAGFPARLEFAQALPHDVMEAQFSAGNEAPQSKYFLLNASLGITALANYRFNQKRGLLGLMQKVSIPASIVATAASTLAGAKPFPLKVTVHDQAGEVKSYSATTHNVAVIKRRYFSGNFRYEENPRIDDGLLDLHFTDGMNRPELWRCLAGLARGRYLGQPKTHSTRIRDCRIELTEVLPIEMDGEVFTAKNLAFRVHGKALNLCPNHS